MPEDSPNATLRTRGRILVIDDEEAIRDSLETLLELERFAVDALHCLADGGRVGGRPVALGARLRERGRLLSSRERATLAAVAWRLGADPLATALHPGLSSVSRPSASARACPLPR